MRRIATLCAALLSLVLATASARADCVDLERDIDDPIAHVECTGEIDRGLVTNRSGVRDAALSRWIGR